MKKNQINLTLIAAICFNLYGCKAVVNEVPLTSTAVGPSVHDQIKGYINSKSANPTNLNQGAIVTLGSDGKVDKTYLPPSRDPVKGCAQYVLPDSSDIIFSRANRSDFSQITGSGVKVTRVASSANSAGAFFGGGTGNKAWIGINSLSGQKVADFRSLKITAQATDGNYTYINMQIDADGDFSTAEDRFVITTNIIAFSATEQTTVEYTPDSVAYLASGYGTFPVAQTGLNPNPAGAYKSLSDLVALNPNARFYSGAFFDGGYPRNCITPAVGMVMGDSSNLIHQTTLFQKFEYNGALYDLR